MKKNKYKSTDGCSLILAVNEAEARELCGCDVVLVEEGCGVEIAIDWGDEPRWWQFSKKAALRDSKRRYAQMEERYGTYGGAKTKGGAQ